MWCMRECGICARVCDVEWGVCAFVGEWDIFCVGCGVRSVCAWDVECVSVRCGVCECVHECGIWSGECVCA